ncbi:SHUGOSHIN 2 [Citrus sinensis]|uniref:SHUGOSHIN 2 isoform X2 n=1 Tax=Citrus sinensis TaxID=2711 RepID=UPI0003D77A00|nr:SHUGOSHIN 2 isoform X2 [Citrus sinensis]XP_024042613.1 SHUGOSHIN 2 isoform X2 [Citrus x clementina]KAH9704028.1 SHUGOSHIN 2 [Citrus sinensis]
MEGLKVLGTENRIDGKAKGEKRAKGSKIGSSPRKRLGDISNMQQLPKPSNQEAKPQQTFSVVTSDYIDKLHKENMTLMKVLTDRNKIIELSGIELQKLRINLQKVQQQNLLLAQANSQMLAELNSGKDKLKALQHELGCKNALVKARKFVLEGKAITVTCATSENQVLADKQDEAGKFIEEQEVDNKRSNTRRRGRPSKNKSLDSSTVKAVQAGEKIDNKRPCLRRRSAKFNSEEAESTEERLCLRKQSARIKSEEAEPIDERLSSRRKSASFQYEEPEQTEKRVVRTRRQSARFKSEEPAPTEDLFEIDEAKFPASPLCDEQVHENGVTSSNLSVKTEQEEGNGAVKDETQGTTRYSGRPSRQAAVKVQSYKEIPLNAKMRRKE